MSKTLDDLSEQLREIANEVTNIESEHYRETAKLDKKIKTLEEKVARFEREKESVLALYQDFHGRAKRNEFELALKGRGE